MGAQEQVYKSQIANIQKYGSVLRDEILQASPELSQLAEFYKTRFEEGLPESLLADYRGNLRQAMEAGGWGTYAGSPQMAEQEANYITKIQEQSRAQIAPQYQQFTGQLTSMAMAQMPQLSFQDISNLMLSQYQVEQQGRQFQQQMNLAEQQFQADLFAAQERSQFAWAQFGATQQMQNEWFDIVKRNEQQTYMASLPWQTRYNLPASQGGSAYGQAQMAPAWSIIGPPNSWLYT